MLFRFVDPDPAATSPAEARVDQVDPSKTVNPVAGFLLPDHIDDNIRGADSAKRFMIAVLWPCLSSLPW